MNPIDTREVLTRLIRKRVNRSNTGSSIDPLNMHLLNQPPGEQKISGNTLQTIPTPTLEQQLRARIKQLKQQPAAGQTLDQAVVGTILAWEFNDALYFEPKFTALAQQVQRHIESEPQLNAALKNIIEQLSR